MAMRKLESPVLNHSASGAWRRRSGSNSHGVTPTVSRPRPAPAVCWLLHGRAGRTRTGGGSRFRSVRADQAALQPDDGAHARCAGADRGARLPVSATTSAVPASRPRTPTRPVAAAIRGGWLVRVRNRSHRVGRSEAAPASHPHALGLSELANGQADDLLAAGRREKGHVKSHCGGRLRPVDTVVFDPVVLLHLG